MKRFDDEDLVAHYLHELAPRKASEMERALQTDPVLAARYEAYVTMLQAYKAEAATMVFDEAVMARNWKALQPAIASSGARPFRSFRWRYPALAGAGLALAATALFVATHSHDAARLTPAAPLHEAGGTGLSSAPPESAVLSAGSVGSLGAPSDALLMAERRYAKERGRAGRHFAYPLTDTPRDPPGDPLQALRLRTGAAMPLNTAEVATPHFIPLASVSLPELPAPQGYPDMPGATAGSTQTGATRGRSKSGHARTGSHHEYPGDLTFAMGGTLIGTRNASGTGNEVHTLGATHAVSAIAAFHQQFRPAVGYRVAVSYTRPDFQYALHDATVYTGQRDINGRVYELATTYVVQGPHRGALSTSAEAGGGVMAILPTVPDAETSYNLRGAAVIGVAAEIALSKHLGIHLGYRAQIFKGPDFQYSGTDKSIVGTTFLSNEPTAGITYRFHSR